MGHDMGEDEPTDGRDGGRGEPGPGGAAHDHGDHDHGNEAECADAVSILWEYLDGELDGVATARVQEHLERCSPCLEAFDFHAELRHVVQLKCNEPIPDDLRVRLMQAIEADPGASSV